MDESELLLTEPSSHVPQDLTEAFTNFLLPLYNSPYSTPSDDMVAKFLSDLGGINTLLEMLSTNDMDEEVMRFVRMACTYVFNNKCGQEKLFLPDSSDMIRLVFQNGDVSDIIALLGALRHGMRSTSSLRLSFDIFQDLLKLLQCIDVGVAEQASFVLLEQPNQQDIERFYAASSAHTIFGIKNQTQGDITNISDDDNVAIETWDLYFHTNTRSDFEKPDLGAIARSPRTASREILLTRILSLGLDIFSRCPSSRCITIFERSFFPFLLREIFYGTEPLTQSTMLSFLSQLSKTRHGVNLLISCKLLDLLVSSMVTQLDVIITSARKHTVSHPRPGFSKKLAQLSFEQKTTFTQPFQWIKDALKEQHFTDHDLSAFDNDEDEYDTVDIVQNRKQISNQSQDRTNHDSVPQILRILPTLFSTISNFSIDLGDFFDLSKVQQSTQVNSPLLFDALGKIQEEVGVEINGYRASHYLPLIFALLLQSEKYADQALHTLANMLHETYFAILFTYPHRLLSLYQHSMMSAQMSPVYYIYRLAMTDQNDSLQSSAYFALTSLFKVTNSLTHVPEISTLTSTSTSTSTTLPSCIQIEDFSRRNSLESIQLLEKNGNGAALEIIQYFICSFLHLQSNEIDFQVFDGFFIDDFLTIFSSNTDSESKQFKKLKTLIPSQQFLLQQSIQFLCDRGNSVLEDKQLTTHMMIASLVKHDWFIRAVLLHPTFDLWLCSAIDSATGETAQACFEWRKRISKSITEHSYFSSPSNSLAISSLTRARFNLVKNAKTMFDLQKNTMMNPMAMVSQ